MKHIVVFFICFISLANSQEKYWTRSGTILFEASIPAFEEVKAINENVTAIVNTRDGTFASLALVKGFRFKNALMEEHFNESYIESDRFPKAIFKGQLLDFDFQNIDNTYTLLGSLEMHGISKPLSVEIQIKKEGEILICYGIFDINTNDYSIEIPKIVRNKVSDTVTVSFDFKLIKKSD
jgi:polyisoprenoid-binding protein YceI